ncbi:polyhydroxyalkanoic acid system family protein [Paraurantiacibacter namhicola]|uniref:Polyhydroxyalkanoic acid system protein n=1 Tax=Paraurantiacibacter namhicola TaxID=645517 RepID=A0A1C7D6J1_9SPHN|nr:polyhydroxyalkanoic acid system family protein [Paraurantiacibacter namhicola]ANU07106.1 hypothetical protein A6F65_00787 [Paraurantiacibacter namhicola]
MQVAIPHSLDKEIVRQRLRDNSDDIGNAVPGGMADITTSWASEDRMDMAISAMGQTMNGHVQIEDDQILFDIELPLALSFVAPMVEGAIRQQGERLIAPPRDSEKPD